MWRLAWRDFVVAALVTASGLALLVWLVPSAPLTGDGEHYVKFARNHLQQGAASWWHARRVLGPLIVSALPTDPLMGFHALTLGSLFAAGLLTWSAARALSVSTAAALASIVLFLGTWAVAPNIREYALVDPLAWLFVAGIWLATVKRRWWLAAVLGAVGVLAKEVVVVAVVAAAAAAWTPSRRWQELWPAAAVLAPAGLVLAVIAVVLPGGGTDVLKYLTKWWADGLGSLGPLRVAYLVFASYGALWLLLPKGFGLLPTHLRRASLVYICAALLLPAVGSPERMEELVFPALLAAGLMALREGGAILVFGFGLANALFVARVGGDARLPPPVAWSGLVLAVMLALSRYVPRSRLGLQAAAGTPLSLILCAISLALPGRPAHAAGNAAVDIIDNGFSPASSTINVGDTVTWSNTGRRVHTSTSDAGVWDSGSLGAGGTFAFTFASAGTFAYHCVFHESMHGTIVVQAASASPTPTPRPTVATPPTATATLATPPTATPAPASAPVPVPVVEVSTPAGDITLVLPGGAVSGSTTLSLAAIPDAHTRFQLTAQDAAGVPTLSFSQPATLTVRPADSDLAEVDGDPSNLTLAELAPDQVTWLVLATSVNEDGTLSTTINEPGTFAILGK